MRTHELLELAGLDALGLLDEHEREAFERAFMAAPPAVQAQIRREQARLARADVLLPDVEPPASLRARVMAAVREAISAVNSRGGVAGRVFPTLLPSRGVSPIWRAAAVGSIAAAIVFGFTTLHMRSEVEKINNLIAANIQSNEWVREFGPRFEQMLFDPNTTFVQFNIPTDVDVAGPGNSRAVILIDGDGTAQFLTKDLPESPHGYALVPISANGTLGQPVLTFNPPAGVKYQDRITNLATVLNGGNTLAVIPQSRTGALAATKAVLRSRAS